MEIICHPGTSFNISSGNNNFEINNEDMDLSSENNQQFSIKFSLKEDGKIIIVFKKISDNKFEDGNKSIIAFRKCLAEKKIKSCVLKWWIKRTQKIESQLALKIQSCFRKWLNNNKEIIQTVLVVKLQSYIRKWLSMKTISSLRYKLRLKSYHYQILKLQSFFRIWLAKRNIEQYRSNIGWKNSSLFKKKNKKNGNKKNNIENPVYKQSAVVSSSSQSYYEKMFIDENHPQFKTVLCRNGENCRFLKKGFCTYYHVGDEQKYRCVPIKI